MVHAASKHQVSVGFVVCYTRMCALVECSKVRVLNIQLYIMMTVHVHVMTVHIYMVTVHI